MFIAEIGFKYLDLARCDNHQAICILTTAVQNETKLILSQQSKHLSTISIQAANSIQGMIVYQQQTT